MRTKVLTILFLSIVSIMYSLAQEKEPQMLNIIGKWKNKTCNKSFEITQTDSCYQYIFKSKLRELKGKIQISKDGDTTYLIFKGIQWSEYLGDLGPEYFEDIEVGTPKQKEKIRELPIDISALLELEENNFVIQNSGNAMNYYIKLEECGEKYIYFNRVKSN